MGDEKLITLKGLLSVIQSEKDITINLFSEEGLLIITFLMKGYPALEDEIEIAEVTKIEFPKINTINVTIKTEEEP